MEINFWNDDHTKLNGVLKYEHKIDPKENSESQNSSSMQLNNFETKKIARLEINVNQGLNGNLNFDCKIWQLKDDNHSKEFQDFGKFFLVKHEQHLHPKSKDLDVRFKSRSKNLKFNDFFCNADLNTKTNLKQLINENRQKINHNQNNKDVLIMENNLNNIPSNPVSEHVQKNFKQINILKKKSFLRKISEGK
jgi:hypothetical protein